MKIVLSNYRFFLSGGPERYLFAVKSLLESHGVTVYPFSVRSKKNVETEYEPYFISPISSEDSVYFEEYGRDIKTVIKVLSRQIYSPEGFLKSRKFAKKFEPDLVYSLHFLNKMSPSVLDGFKSRGKPVVVRLSDFELICPQGLLLRNGMNCELCLENSLFSSVRHKCVKESFVGSLIKVYGAYFRNLTGMIGRIDAFVCPSEFTRKKYLEAGFPKEKLHYIPSFIDAEKIQPDYDSRNHILYFGRVSKEKGVHILLEAYQMIDIQKPRLLVIGDIEHSDYSCSLKKKYGDQVQFMDFIPKDKLYTFVQNAIFVVVPSVCYDNIPNVVLESFAHGKAVIASDHGSFPEIIDETHTGLLFEPGNSDDLAEKLTWAITHPHSMIEMGRNAREVAETTFSPNLHLSRLLELFETFL